MREEKESKIPQDGQRDTHSKRGGSRPSFVLLCFL